MNLIEDPWIPIRRRSGTEERIAPHQLTEREDPVVALASPRPDFDGALAQFLIGLLQTACPPRDVDQWEDWLEEPPAPATLREAFASWNHAFELDGDGPRFMQDITELSSKPDPIDRLLIDVPGAQTLRLNADHFVKRGHSEVCLSCATTALLTLQLNAPTGGAGHRVSLRGGGPLTTLLVLDPFGTGLDPTLWRNLWLNVLPIQEASSLFRETRRDAYYDIFPWCGPTRTSEARTGTETTPEDAHSLQMYWCMPRRIRIFWEGTEGLCSVCNTKSERLVHEYETRNYGIKYTGGWRHPLSPYRKTNEGDWLPLHPQPGGISYRLWPALVFGDGVTQPATVVAAFKSRRLREEQLRIWAFGYDMDNMKPRCWYETTLPLYHVPEAIREDFATRVQTLVETATLATSYLRDCVKQAWFSRPGDDRRDVSGLSQAFFDRTEAAFYATVEKLIQGIPTQEDYELLRAWHGVLCEAAFGLFESRVASGDAAFGNPRRVAAARQNLRNQLYGKKLQGRLVIEKEVA